MLDKGSESLEKVRYIDGSLCSPNGIKMIVLRAKKELTAFDLELDSDDSDLGFWISSTGKTHNVRCRYFKTSKGKLASIGSGNNCKICGGDNG